MREHRVRRRVAVLVLIAVATAGWSADDASAKRDSRCNVDGFALPIESQSWTAVYTGDANYASVTGEWTAEGVTTLACPNRIIGVDVWEHAYYVKVDPKDGDDTVIIKGNLSYRLTADFDGDGSDDVLNLDGRITGEGIDRDGIVTLRFKGRGSAPDGSRINLRHRGTLDVAAEELRDLNVARGLFNPTAVAFTP